MKFKIVSDGTAKGTEVFNAETGELIDWVIAVHWKADARKRDGFGHATLLVHASCELLAEGKVLDLSENEAHPDAK